MITYASIKTLTTIAKKVKEESDKELFDLPTIEKKLIHLQMMMDLEEITEEAFKEQEAELLSRYETAKQREIDEWEALIEQKEDE